MRKFQMLFVVATFSFALIGCTGTRMTVNPSPDSFQEKYTVQYDTIGVKEIPPDKTYPPAGLVVSDFARELELSGIANNIYYPLRHDDEAEFILESKFNVTFDPHAGSSMVKAFFTGFTLFLLEPIFWYHYDYSLFGQVDLIKQGTRTDNINATSNGYMGMKFLSLGQAQNLELDTLKKAKTSLFRQIIKELAKE